MKKLLLLLFGGFIAAESNAQSKKDTPVTDTDRVTSVFYIEPQPQFPGGDKAFKKFLAKNLKWPDGDIDAEGSVIITFLVRKDGTTTNFKVLRGIHPIFDQEAMRVLKKMPKWKPKIQNGKPVACNYTLPVRFGVSNE